MRSPRIIALLVVAGIASGFISTHRWEHSYLPSPDGKLVASAYSTSMDLMVPVQPVELRNTVSLKVRDMKGKSILSRSVKKGKESYTVSHGSLHLAWSPDSKRIAYRSGGDLAVAECTTKKTVKLAANATSFRWEDSSHIVYVTDGSSVIRVSVDGKTSATLFSGKASDEFHASTSLFHNQLSPDVKRFVYMTEQAIRVASLEGEGLPHSESRSLHPSFCWWRDDSSLCLIHGLASVKTDKQWPQDTALRNTIYLYEPKTGSFADLSGHLQKLNKNWNQQVPRPQAPSRVWSSDGSWFIVMGTVERKRDSMAEMGYTRKNWICRPEPWSALCIQDLVGPEFEYPSIAPAGPFIVMNKAKRPATSDGAWYVMKVTLKGKNGVTISDPVKILPASKEPWFWAADGKSVISVKRGKFTTHIIPEVK